MRRGFTLLEILTVVAIIAIMVTASVISVRQGQGAARIRGAARDIFAIIRHARSMALVSQQKSKIIYSCTTDPDTKEAMAKIEIETAKMFVDNSVKVATTLSGETVKLVEDDEPVENGLHKSYTVNGEDPIASDDFQGQSVEDVLFAPISTDVLRGIRIKVTREGESLDGAEDRKQDSKISVSYTYEGKMFKYESAQKERDASFAESSDQEPVQIEWEANGRTEPHRVWIYPDGSDPEKGLSIKVDRFGGAKVIGSGGEEDDL